jgi:hypothetical protein
MQGVSIGANAAGGHKDLDVSIKFRNGSNGCSIAIHLAIASPLSASNLRMAKLSVRIEGGQKLISIAMHNWEPVRNPIR